jgi:DNA-binding CsgD family transcriptional regulator
VTVDEFIVLTSALGLDPSQFLTDESPAQSKVPADSGPNAKMAVRDSYSVHDKPSYNKLSEILNVLSSRWRLSPREREILGLLVGGLTNKDIAAQLGVSKYTISSYIGRIRDKMGVRTRRQLTHIILEEAHFDIDE